jgi:hypothetical protein
MDSMIAQALPSLMSVGEPGDSAETKLPVHEDEVSVIDPGTCSAELSERVVKNGGV